VHDSGDVIQRRGQPFMNTSIRESFAAHMFTL
jgi:hypothetical protein